MASQSVTALRTYAGEQGDERIARRREQLMDAALEVLGSDDGGALTVRGVCREAKLTARYFYESFDSADDLVAAAYDRVVDEISGAASDAFGRGTDIRSRARGAVEAIVRVIDDDRRKGRLMFSPKLLSTTLATRRMAATRSLAALTVQTTAGTHHEPTEADVAAAYYRVGGLGNLLSAWLDDRVQLPRDELIDACTGLLLGE
ncbi:MAG TPA: TetR/AcrR family transcriptional regulator [Gordonia sp. (in: high G+C Gram-positive bacteria)]|uniref:TetR/AcrR family transcriptional regulator n=1 Tax=unclassified Gordonia (in: high G+C Gram-positive bacteria) TaxID=2657482 RepID=UPI000FB69983|nr:MULTISPECIES: TetR/AcrR family transcriptional regulator [unclassified Gordonia (in: high G+C Gram-positive bacteria)]RUP36024.1 MAG: TetR/AcrR family transcriptional regulator [Gordonia sp. (in: high G+C Gram-positive bacteria)]HNP57940.1 TetR/AcrR family transcriptional regulator [Gordonia sp. (in: high G+C Gram-positive bacteria)]HRC49337.1 TetR/AcrR family transcriptional regulator [Gordonia sp. (in: high G+C Gram-positive bacteria)]